MTLTSTVNRWNYLGNGAASEYDFTQKIFAAEDARLVVRDPDGVETVLDLDDDFSVPAEVLNDSAGGTIPLIDDGQEWIDAEGDLATGYTLAIRRVVAITQPTDFRNQETLHLDDLEDTFDRLVMIDQQQQDEIDRSIKLPETEDPADFSLTLPAMADRANKLLACDSSGNITAVTNLDTEVEVSAFVDTLLDDATAAAFFTTLGITPFVQTLLDDTTASNFMTTLGISAFAKTILDDTTGAAVQTTIGITAAAQSILDDATVADILTTLGISAFVQTILNDAAATNVLDTLGVSAFVQTILNDVDAATVRSTIGALGSVTAGDIPAASISFDKFKMTLVHDADHPVTSGNTVDFAVQGSQTGNNIIPYIVSYSPNGGGTSTAIECRQFVNCNSGVTDIRLEETSGAGDGTVRVKVYRIDAA